MKALPKLHHEWTQHMARHPRLVIEAPRTHGKSTFVAGKLRPDGSPPLPHSAPLHILVASDSKAKSMARRIGAQRRSCRHVDAVLDAPIHGLRTRLLLVDQPVDMLRPLLSAQQRVFAALWEEWCNLGWKKIVVVWTPMGPNVEFFRGLVADWHTVRFGYGADINGYTLEGSARTDWPQPLFPEVWPREKLEQRRKELGGSFFDEGFLVDSGQP